MMENGLARTCMDLLTGWCTSERRCTLWGVLVMSLMGR